MKQKLLRVANQIYDLELKIQKGENLTENMEKLEKLTESLSLNELFEVTTYLEEKFNIKL